MRTNPVFLALLAALAAAGCRTLPPTNPGVLLVAPVADPPLVDGDPSDVQWTAAMPLTAVCTIVRSPGER